MPETTAESREAALRERLENVGVVDDWKQTWREGDPDYVALLGAEPRDVPLLVEVALQWFTAEERGEECRADDPASYAPMHAWRTLAQMRAEEAAADLAVMISDFAQYEDDLLSEEFDWVVGQLGPRALPVLESLMGDEYEVDWVRAMAAETINKTAQAWPDIRERAVAMLAEKLERFRDEDPFVNSFVIDALLDLKATEAADLIQRAFGEWAVDEIAVGGWPEARHRLGLGPEPKRPTGAPRDGGVARSRADQQRRRAKRKRERQNKKRSRR